MFMFMFIGQRLIVINPPLITSSGPKGNDSLFHRNIVGGIRAIIRQTRGKQNSKRSFFHPNQKKNFGNNSAKLALVRSIMQFT